MIYISALSWLQFLQIANQSFLPITSLLFQNSSHSELNCTLYGPNCECFLLLWEKMHSMNTVFKNLQLNLLLTSNHQINYISRA